MTKPSFKLSSTLAGHNSDVRSLSASPAGPILFSSSRDGTARSWHRDEQKMQVDGIDPIKGGNWVEGNIFAGHHSGFVNSCCWIPAENGGFLATGGQDKLINVWPLEDSAASSSKSASVSHTLIGHEANVCALHASADGKTLVSGSWDKTAKVWKNFQLAYTLSGHEQSVWAVLALGGQDDLVLTGAADNLVKLWSGSKLKLNFRGHSEPVRALAKLDAGVGEGDLFASAGNDASIRLWSLTTADCVHVLYGHSSFIYSLSPIPDSAGGGLISGGEDRTIKVWRAADGECQQSIVVPATSVWTVTALSSGDIVAGTSDGLIRIFTRDEERAADAETLKTFDEQVSKTALNSSQLGDVKKENLPSLEALNQPGTKDGHVMMVKTPAGAVEAHSWSSAANSWTKIGEVTGAVSNSSKQIFNGQEFDHLFDVDFKDGAPKLKLPYNNGQNAYEAAQKFLLANELPLEYTEQVVEFIDKNTQGVTLGGASDYVDPYTGNSRYTGGGVGSTPTRPNNSFAGDPFTGGGRTAPVAPKPISLLPHKKILTFPQANLAALRTKLGQLNSEVDAAVKLTADELVVLDNLIAFLLVAITSPNKNSCPAENQLAVALKLLAWPAAQRFPGLDLVRLISLTASIPDCVPKLLNVFEADDVSGKVFETNSLLTLRALANLFNSSQGQKLMQERANDVITTLSHQGTGQLTKLGKNGLATLILNFSILAVNKKLDSKLNPELLKLVTPLLQDADSEIVYRSLIALGNLLLSQPSSESRQHKEMARQAGNKFNEPRMKSLIAEIEKL